MIEKFEYPKDLSCKLKKEHKNRIIVFILLALPFWTFAFFYGNNYITLSGAIGISLLLFYFDFQLNKFARTTLSLIGQTIEAEDEIIREVSKNSDIICEINIKENFDVHYPYHAGGNAIYIVKQRGKRLLFSSRINNAERLVREILGYEEWPPGDNEMA